MLTERRYAASGPLRARARTSLSVLLALSLCGCGVKRSGYDVPEIPLPREYRNTATEAPASPDAPASLATAEWWRSFGDARLAEIVDRGLANNPDIRIATLRLAQAKAHADQARAGLLPSITAPLGSAVQAPGGTIGSVPVGTADQSIQTTYYSSLRAAWRLDVWGEARSSAEAASFQLWQAGFDRDNVQRNVVAGIAAAYVELLSLNDRIRVARETEAVLNEMLATVEARMAIGDATRVELQQQKATVSAARTVLPGLEQQREDSRATIAFLAGTVPGSIGLADHGLDALITPTASPSVPSSLLLQRPDIRMAEARLLAADANIDVARARLMPPVDLSGQVGLTGLSIAKMLSPGALFWNLISSVTASIFDGGKLEAERANATAVHEEMVESYARTIYQAVREVESALVAVRTTRQRLDEQRQVVESARQTLDSNAEMFALGGVDQMGLLDAQRSYQRYVEEYLRVRMEHYRGYVGLFQALDGGTGSAAQLPGSGTRPGTADEANRLQLTRASHAPATPGLDWTALGTDKDPQTGELFWQVELPGLYHRATVDATVRDLRTRFPALMEAASVRPRLHGRVPEAPDPQFSWYRLYVGRFSTPGGAHDLCAALRTGYQRCRVVSSQSESTVLLTAPPGRPGRAR